jgi:glycosyltransferase involved in cell wall biosynthesis
MRISVVIPTHNRKDALRRCLAAAMSQDYPDYDVIVVDDGSTDGTGEMVQREFPQVRTLRQEPCRGPAAARNRGIEAASGEMVAFTDDDCVVPPEWLTTHASYYADPAVGAVGGVQMSTPPNFFDRFEMAHYAHVYTEFQRITALGRIGGLVTNNLSIRRQVVDQAGYFDEAFLTGSDPEFTRRIAMAGYVLIHDPALRVEHLKVHTLRSYLRMRFRRGCGSLLNEIKVGRLSLRQFVPLVNLPRAWRDWQNFRSLFGSDAATLFRFWTLTLLVRVVDVAGRCYYFWTVGHRYSRHRGERP